MTVDVLDLHRELVAIPSVSHAEGPIADFVEAWLRERGLDVERLGRNILARSGRPGGPRLLLNTHLDTVPAGCGWTREPHAVTREGDRIYGLGSNDAKASVAAMMAAVVEAGESADGCDLTLMLVADEETGGEGTEHAWPVLRDRGWIPDGVVIGEPTGLDIATDQKGMLVLELTAAGDACHSAHAGRLAARNPIRGLARDLVALEEADLGPESALLGRTTLEPTVVRAGEARNRVPASASCFLDGRTVPGIAHAQITERIRSHVQGELRVVSDRLEPFSCPSDAAVLRAARAARPAAKTLGSATMSDIVFFRGVPGVKVGPGRTDRSHTPDEFVLAPEVEAGARFYRARVTAFAREAGGDRP